MLINIYLPPKIVGINKNVYGKQDDKLSKHFIYKYIKVEGWW